MVGRDIACPIHSDVFLSGSDFFCSFSVGGLQLYIFYSGGASTLIGLTIKDYVGEPVDGMTFVVISPTPFLSECL